MKISSMNIDGFGIFNQTSIDDLSPGINIFIGSNEAGKSTLLGYIRSILYGIPDARMKENPYTPVFGGKHGGNLTIIGDDDKSYVIERYAGKNGG